MITYKSRFYDALFAMLNTGTVRPAFVGHEIQQIFALEALNSSPSRVEEEAP
jgi:hypothetical protein